MNPTATELINSGKKNAARYTLVMGPGSIHQHGKEQSQPVAEQRSGDGEEEGDAQRAVEVAVVQASYVVLQPDEVHRRTDPSQSKNE